MIRYSIRSALRVMIPARMADVKAAGGPEELEIESALKFLTDYKSSKLGKAELLNRIAAAVAVLAFTDGGIKFLGDWWGRSTPLPEPAGWSKK